MQCVTYESAPKFVLAVLLSVDKDAKNMYDMHRPHHYTHRI